MSARNVWKSWERHWATLLGGIRVPVTGRQRGSAPDVAHPVFAIEIKYGNVMSERLTTGMAQAEAAAAHIVETEGVRKFPLLCISNRNGKRSLEHYVVMKADDFVKWMNGGKA